jgi:hypothetical protein
MQSHYTLRPSRRYLRLLAALCALLFAAVAFLPFAFQWRFAGGVLAVAACAFVGLRDARLKFPRSCVAFRLEGENGITLIQRNGEHVTGTVAAGVVAPWLVLLNVRDEGGGERSLMLFPDSMNRDAFRRLRIALRWSRGS